MPSAPFVILIVGVNGSGKTTTIGKLARRCASEGSSVMLAAGDTFRAAAIEQLKVWAERNRRRVCRPGPGADPGAVVFDALQAAEVARHATSLLADTAGRLHSQSHLMDELKKIKRVLQRSTPPRRTKCCWCSMPTRARTRSRRRAQFHEAVGVTGPGR